MRAARLALQPPKENHQASRVALPRHAARVVAAAGRGDQACAPGLGQGAAATPGVTHMTLYCLMTFRLRFSLGTNTWWWCMRVCNRVHE